jgi:hypothetical protein
MTPKVSFLCSQGSANKRYIYPDALNAYVTALRLILTLPSYFLIRLPNVLLLLRHPTLLLYVRLEALSNVS